VTKASKACPAESGSSCPGGVRRSPGAVHRFFHFRCNPGAVCRVLSL